MKSLKASRSTHLKIQRLRIQCTLVSQFTDHPIQASSHGIAYTAAGGRARGKEVKKQLIMAFATAYSKERKLRRYSLHHLLAQREFSMTLIHSLDHPFPHVFRT